MNKRRTQVGYSELTERATQANTNLITTSLCINCLVEGLCIAGTIYSKFHTIIFSFFLVVCLFGFRQLQPLIVIGLVMHKIPEAISFGNFLLTQNYSPRQIIQNLIVRFFTYNHYYFTLR